jgi:DNA-binding MarR family transcriptional regulator
MTKKKGGDAEHERRKAESVIVNGLRRIMRSIRLSAATVQTKTGISAAQLYVLRQLAEDRTGVSIGQLANETLTDRSSVASAVDGLVAAGLAERGTSRKDRRRAEVHITPAGEKLVHKAAPPPTSKLVTALETLSDKELKAMAEAMGSLVHAMHIERTPAGMFLGETPETNGKKKH